MKTEVRICEECSETIREDCAVCPSCGGHYLSAFGQEVVEEVLEGSDRPTRGVEVSKGRIRTGFDRLAVLAGLLAVPFGFVLILSEDDSIGVDNAFMVAAVGGLLVWIIIRLVGWTLEGFIEGDAARSWRHPPGGRA
jgi:hypothetical protein